MNAPESLSRPWPAYTVERKPMAWLKPYPKNARTHNKAQLEQLRGSLKQFGWTIPVLAREDGTIIAGHGRVEAGKLEGITEVPVIVATGWSETQCRAYALADNRISLNSTWDEAMLGVELQELSGLGVDLGTLGFDDVEIDALAGTGGQGGLTDPDEAPEPPADPVAMLGDLWALGRHRLLCGDCTKPEDTQKVMGGASPHLMVTDPPYGIQRDKGFGGFGGFGTPIARRNYTDDWDSERPSQQMFDALLEFAADSIIFGGNFFADILPRSTHWIVWDKQNTMPTFGDCELAWTTIKRKSVKKYTVIYNGLIGKEKERFHPTQKPVELLRAVIADYASPHANILDPLVGSGTTIIAAEMTGRVCHAIEIAPAYIDVCIKRWCEFTGQSATLIGDGRTFNQIAAERQPKAA